MSLDLDNLLESLGSYAKDVKHNVKAVLTEEGAPQLQQKQIYGVAMAAAYTTQNKILIDALTQTFQDKLSANEFQAAKAAATIMAMNNIYFHFLHLSSNAELSKMPINLQMSFMSRPGVSNLDFALYSLAVSILNGCGYCINVHMTHILKAPSDGQNAVGIVGIQSIGRIAATINSLAQALVILS
jgi:lipoyl-dependent peroxiredoxin subunit D